MGLGNRVLGLLGLQRKRAAQRTYFAGAQGGRLTADWIFSPMVSGNQEWKAEGWKLRGRAREMVRNDPTFARYVNLLADNVAGADGVQCSPRLYSKDGKLLEKESRQLGYEFAEFSERDSFSRDGRMCRAEFEQQICRLTPPDGESFVQIVPTTRNRFGLTLQFVDPDLIDNQFYQEPAKGANEIFAGIEIDADGRPLFYHTWSDYRKTKRVPVSADWMLHLFWTRRVGDIRGITNFAPAMMLARMLHGYREAEVVAARTGAGKMAFLVPTDPESIVPIGTDKPELPMNAAAGTIEELPYGYRVDTFAPDHPSTAYDPFVRSVKGDIAASLSHAYVTLYGDWSQTNFSSGKMPVMSERDHYRGWQQWLVNGFDRPVYEKFLQLSHMRGAIELPTQDYRAHRDAMWRPRRWPLYDPKNDIDVMRTLLDLKLTTRTQLASDLGGVWEEVIEQYAADQKLADHYKVDLKTEAVAEAIQTTTEMNNGDQASGTAKGAAADGNDRARLKAL